MTGAPASLAEDRRLPRVLAVASHPIQYQAPWFRALAQTPGMDFSVLFIQQPSSIEQGRGFGQAFQWDIPLLEGYVWQQVPRIRGKGGLNGYFAARVVHPLSLLRQLKPDVVLITGWQRSSTAPSRPRCRSFPD